MKRSVLWEPWTGWGLENLTLKADGESVVADGVVIGVTGGDPFRLRYRVRCDAGWRVRELDVSLLTDDTPGTRILADGKGYWTTTEGEHVSILNGCIDVDLSVTPFTNTLPIRRLKLEPGESEELDVVYIDAPKMEVEPARQRYTCLERGARGGIYRYESLDGSYAGFTAGLPVDAEGLVLDYPDLFRRVRL